MREQALPGELLVGGLTDPCLLVLRPHPGRDRLLIQPLALEAHTELRVRRLGGPQLELGFPGGQLQLGVAELQDHGVGFDHRPGLHHDTLDASVGEGRDPADLFGHEGAEAPHLAHHAAPLDGVRPDG